MMFTIIANIVVGSIAVLVFAYRESITLAFIAWLFRDELTGDSVWRDYAGPAEPQAQDRPNSRRDEHADHLGIGGEGFLHEGADI